MTWTDVERSFNRALLKGFSWQKILLTYSALLLCGILFVFCRALSFNAGGWVRIGLTFLPILLSCSVLLSLGILICRMYRYELKQMSVPFNKLFIGSINALVSTSYFSIPSVLLYVTLWIVLGIFFLLKEIPGIGSFVTTLLAFAPFLLIFSFVLLCFLHVASLFFIAPVAANFSVKRIQLFKTVISLLQRNPFASIALFFIGLLPVVLAMVLLMWVGSLTSFCFTETQGGYSSVLQWFFIMFPFVAFLTPPVVFFFHFAFEANQLRSS